MKSLVKFILLAALSLVVLPGNSAEITDNYATGDTLTATMMNNIKNAVNDNDSTKQDRVSGTCAAGSSIRTINSDGTVVCETDTDTTYSAGSGLSLTGTTFSLSGSPAGVANFDENTCCTAVPTTGTQFASVTIDSPSIGYAIVSYSGICRLTHVNVASTTVQSITIAISTTSGNTVTGSRKSFSLPGNAGTGLYSVPCSTQQVLPVTVGVQTFYLNAIATLPTAGEAASIGFGNMHALFVSNQY